MSPAYQPNHRLNSAYHGRFAPSPTGPLHAGSFLTAVASYLDARSQKGFWHLRIDDLDSARNIDSATTGILEILESAGLTWDGPVFYQSQQIEKYRDAIATLDRKALLYACTCSRKDLNQIAASSSNAQIYPGYCRDRKQNLSASHAIRIRTNGASIGFSDNIQGYFKQNLENEVGDFILLRRDGVFAYQLAVVIDDASQRITRIVRGIDLIESTPRQIYLRSLLGLPEPEYCHVPLVVNRHGIKLSKQNGARAVRQAELSRVIFEALSRLRQIPPLELQNAPPKDLLRWGIENWNLGNLAGTQTVS